MRLLRSAHDRSDPDSIHRYILETYPDTIVAAIEGGTFYSCDPANFSELRHRGHQRRLRRRLEPEPARGVQAEHRRQPRHVPAAGREQEAPDYTALNQLMPHPIYARQHYVSILNPSADAFEDLIKPLLEEAHARTAAQYARRKREERLATQPSPVSAGLSTRDASRSPRRATTRAWLACHAAQTDVHQSSMARSRSAPAGDSMTSITVSSPVLRGGSKAGHRRRCARRRCAAWTCHPE